MILGTSAMDVPDDEGGRLAVSWEPSIAEDCAFLTVYIQPSAISDRTEDGAGGPEPSSVEGFSVASIIPDCASNGTTIDAIDGQPLINGVAYDVGVVASEHGSMPIWVESCSRRPRPSSIASGRLSHPSLSVTSLRSIIQMIVEPPSM